MKYPNFTTSARDDLREAWSYIAENNIEAANRIAEEIDEVCIVLADNPMLGKTLVGEVENLRIFPCKHYGIFYTPTDYGVEIYRVLHSARDIDSLIT